MPEELKPDICIIGGGPAGIRLAIAAAAASAPVVLIEKGSLGGASLARGAVPVQALAAAASRVEALRSGRACGITADGVAVDFAALRDHVRSVRDAVAPTMSAARLAALGVTVIPAAAAFADGRTVAAGDALVRARRTVIATGAVLDPPRIAGLDLAGYLTSETVLDLAARPDRLVVIGANPRALAIAQAYQRLGVATTVIDEAPALDGEDPELAAIVLDRLRGEGVRIIDRAKVASVTRGPDGVRVSLLDEGEVVIAAADLVVETGRKPLLDGLNLDAAGIMYDRAGITVDRLLKTTNRRVYAIGDAIAGPALVSRAEHEADHVARGILYRSPRRISAGRAPAIALTDPVLARLGLTEAEAAERHRGIRVLRYPFVENDRAQAERRPEGVIKVVATRQGRILGVGIVGHDAAELIALWSLAVANRLDLDAVARLIPPYPSRSEISRRAALGLHGPGLTPPWRRRMIELLRKFG